jgi:hypothetical protein
MGGAAMRIKLEYDDGPVFSTLTNPLLKGQEKFRTMMVRINGKPFSVWRTVDPLELEFRSIRGTQDYMKAVDEALVAAMEKMFTRIFEDAVAAIEPGTELLKEQR